jgi:hypothetical protein
MEDDKVDQPVGKPGEFLVEADVVVSRATSPTGFLVPDGDLVAGKAVFPGKVVKAFPEEALRPCP